MGEHKKTIVNRLNNLKEAKILVKPEDFDNVSDKLGDDDVVKFVDEQNVEESNKFSPQFNNKSIEEDINSSELRADVQKFMDKLNLGQFESILGKIDKPAEQAEIIAAFAERIGVPRTKLPTVLQALRNVSETIKPKMKKADLVEFVLKNKK